MANIAKVVMLGKKDIFYACITQTNSSFVCEKFSFQALYRRHIRSIGKTNKQ